YPETAKTLHTEVCCGYDTPPPASVSSLLHIDDEPDIVSAGAFGHADAVKRGGLYHRAGAVASEVDGLAVEDAMNETFRECIDLHPPDREALDLVHVEALVDEAHQQCFGTIALRAHFADLASIDTIGADDERQHSECRACKGLGPRRAPGVHADVGLAVEVVVPRGLRHRAGRRPSARIVCSLPWPRAASAGRARATGSARVARSSAR